MQNLRNLYSQDEHVALPHDSPPVHPLVPEPVLQREDPLAQEAHCAREIVAVHAKRIEALDDPFPVLMLLLVNMTRHIRAQIRVTARRKRRRGD